MKSKIKSKTIGLLVSCVFLFPLISSAELLMEESFKTGTNSAAGEYALILSGNPAVYTISGQSNTVTGFTGTWYETRGSSPQLDPTGLEYSHSGKSMVTSGGSLRVRYDQSRSGRNLSVPFDSETTGIYYLGFLFKRATLIKGSRTPFALYSGTLRPEDRDLSLSVNKHADGSVNVDLWGDTVSLDDLGTDVCFAVFRFDMSPVAASDSVKLYINPPLDTRLELQTPVHTVSGIDVTFNILGVERWVGTGSNDDHNVYLDEIRMSKNYYEVSTVHPPRVGVFVVR